MRIVTNLQLLVAGVTIALLVVLAALVGPLDSLSQHERFWPRYLIVGGLGVIALVVLERSIGNNNAFWRRPVSLRASSVVTNLVVGLWLVLVALLIYLLFLKKGSLTLGIIVAALCVGACFLGYRLGKRMHNATLLPYGITFLGALVAITAALALGLGAA